MAKGKPRLWAKLRAFWQRTSDGLNARQLWAQFRRETRSSLNLYSAETGRNLGEEWSARKGRRRVLAAVAGAIYDRLTPVRRVLLLVALVLLVIPGGIESGGSRLRISFNSTPSALILVVVLVLELSDRVGLKRDLEIARDIQRMLLPEKPPALPGLDIAFATQAANTVAGDYYDAFLRPNTGDSRLLLIVADVAGKGIPAGLLMAAVETGFHTLAADPVPLVELAARLNRAMCERSGGGRHLITAFIAELDNSTRTLIWVNAGHNPPLLRRSGGALERLEAGGLPLGAFPVSRYESGRSELGPGDVLCIYTDGVIEALDQSGAEYGEDRLATLVGALGTTGAAASLSRIFESVNQFASGVPQYDDITCLVLRVAAADQGSARSRVS
ncbi:MAG: PP2C family protein-serine/threonine phosphatase [Bryobacteraceae bacterium]